MLVTNDNTKHISDTTDAAGNGGVAYEKDKNLYLLIRIGTGSPCAGGCGLFPQAQ
jgi:hypothetical protein